MRRRVYDATAVDSILKTMRRNLQGAINQQIAETQSVEGPQIERLKQIDRVLLGIETAIQPTQFMIEEVNEEKSSTPE